MVSDIPFRRHWPRSGQARPKLPAAPALSTARGPAPRLVPTLAITIAIAIGLAGCAPLASDPRTPDPARPEATPPAIASSAPSVPVVILPPQPETLPPPVMPGPLRRLLEQADRLQALGTPELALEITRLGDPGDAAEPLVTLALALMQTRLPADTARAQSLLQRAAQSGSADARALAPLTRLLLARVNEQRRLEDQLDRQGQQLRETQRRLDQLNERLEAMRAIERSLNSRPAAAPHAPPAGGTRGTP